MNSNYFTKTGWVVFWTLCCTLLWGTAYPCVKIGYALFAISPTDTAAKLLYAGIRFFLAGCMTTVVFLVTQKHLYKPNKTQWRGIARLGLFQTFLQYVFFYIGLSNTTGVKGSIIYATATFLSLLFAHWTFANDHLSLSKCLGCVIGFLGVACILVEPTGLDTNFTVVGEGFLLISTVASAWASVVSRQVTQKQDPIAITGYQLMLGGLGLIVCGIIGQGHFGAISVQGILLMAYMAFLSAAAFTLWNLLLKYNTVSRISVYNFLIPIFGTMFSVWFLGESFGSIRSIIALFLACAGIYIVNREQTP